MCGTTTILKEQVMQDNLELANYFPTTVYSIHKPEFMSAALTVFDEHVNRRKQRKKLNSLYPVYMTPNLFMDPRIKDLSTYIASTAWNILKAQGYVMDNKVTYFQSMWGHQHHKSSGMDQHIHAQGAQIVGFYFLDVPDKSSRIVIHDPRAGKVQIDMEEADNKTITNATSSLYFPAGAGKLFFTNAWLPHGFTRHNSTQPLKFLHFNIGVQQVQIPQQQEEVGPVIV
jgi:hypothetical protein